MKRNISRRSFLKESLAGSVAFGLVISRLGVAKTDSLREVMDSCENSIEDKRCYVLLEGACRGFGCEYFERESLENYKRTFGNFNTKK